MKNYITILLLVSAFVISPLSLSAQKEGYAFNAGKKIFEAQLVEIKKQLNLNESSEERLESILRSYNNELEMVRKIQLRNPRNIGQIDTISDAKAERIILSQISSGRLYLQIRQKYYFELKKILSPKDILKIYRIEQDVNHRIMIEINKRKSEENRD